MLAFAILFVFVQEYLNKDEDHEDSLDDSLHKDEW